MKDKKMMAFERYFEAESLKHRKRKELIKSIGEILFLIFLIGLFYIGLILINIMERGF
ncbi:hypothetical protein [uncultured Mediterranean phage uvMED]|nr:hypothetical protein [uncultured Mediterranean phage uvMED]